MDAVSLDALDNVGKEIGGRYRILTRLGEGGMGTVYRAEQISLKRTVAVKVLKSELSADPALVRRFNAEAEVAARLNHPNTVTLYDFGQDEDGSLFIAMEYVEGDSLREVMLREGPMPTPRALHICAQVCASIADAHSHGIIHRDLKPDNVMLTVRGKISDVVRVLDFGIAKLRDKGGDITAMPMTQAGDLLGTPQYMAPEQIRGEKVDARTDVYAMGAMIYELVTGRLPFEAPTLMAILSKHLTELPVPPTDRRADLAIPQSLSAFVMKALAKQPNDRPPSMELFGDRLREIHGAMSGAQALPAAPAPASQAAPVAMHQGMPSVVGPPPGVPRRLGSPVANLTPPPNLQAPVRAPIEDSLAVAADSLARSGQRVPQVVAPPAQHRAAAPDIPATREHVPGKSRAWVWAVLAVLVISGVGVGTFFALKKSGKTGNEDAPSKNDDNDNDNDDDDDDGEIPSLHDWDLSDSDGPGASGAEATKFASGPQSSWRHPSLPVAVKHPAGFEHSVDGTTHILSGTVDGQPISIYIYASVMPSKPNFAIQEVQLRSLVSEAGGVVARVGKRKVGGKQRFTAIFKSVDNQTGQAVVYVKDRLLVLVGVGTRTPHFADTNKLRRRFFNKSVSLF